MWMGINLSTLSKKQTVAWVAKMVHYSLKFGLDPNTVSGDVRAGSDTSDTSNTRRVPSSPLDASAAA